MCYKNFGEEVFYTMDIFCILYLVSDMFINKLSFIFG